MYFTNKTNMFIICSENTAAKFTNFDGDIKGLRHRFVYGREDDQFKWRKYDGPRRSDMRNRNNKPKSKSRNNDRDVKYRNCDYDCDY